MSSYSIIDGWAKLILFGITIIVIAPLEEMNFVVKILMAVIMILWMLIPVLMEIRDIKNYREEKK